MIALDSILILGTSRNHRVTNLDNEEHVEVREWIFSPEIHELTKLCERACCDDARRIQPSAISIETQITLFLRRSRLQDNIFDSLSYQVVQIL
jgi:hypothetical protein